MASFTKICKFCSTEIEMSNTKTGNWLPYSISTGQIHDCLKRGTG